MARNANTMRGKTLKPMATEEQTFLGRGGGETKVVTEIFDISLLAEGLAFKASLCIEGTELRALAMGSSFFQDLGTSPTYATQVATSSCQATKPIFSFVKYAIKP